MKFKFFSFHKLSQILANLLISDFFLRLKSDVSKLKTFTQTRHFRKYARVLIRLIILSTIIWIVMFNTYMLVYKLNTNKKKPIKKTIESTIPTNLTHERMRREFKLNNNNNSPSTILFNKNFHAAKIIDSKTLEFFKKIQRKNYDVNCQRLIEWDEDEVRKSKRLLHNLRVETGEINTLHDANFIFEKSMCGLFRELRGYDSHKISPFERNFPIAFIVLTYENVEQFERLLRAIYRPQNVYCIHVDFKSSSEFHKAIKSIAQCFTNVFVATRLEKIVYAGFGRLKADLNCMKDLLEPDWTHANLAGKNFTKDWRYLLNLASSEYPLRTNYELARILDMFNGANDIEIMGDFPKERTLYSWSVRKNANTKTESLVRTSKLKSAVPHNFTIMKGIAYCSFSRKFVEYVVFNKYAKNLLEWSKDTYSPDEWYWATLQYNTQFNPPGGFHHPNKTYVPTRARFIGWRNSYKCMGELRHNICVFSIEDLPELVTRNEFFANKFLIEYDPVSYQCLEEWLHDKITLKQIVNIISYCRLMFVIPYSKNPSCARLIHSRRK